MSEKKNNTVLDPEMLSEALKAQTKDTIEIILEKAVKSYLKEAAGDDDFEDDAEKAEPTEPEMDEPTVDEVPADGGEPAAEEPVEEPAAEEQPEELGGDTEEPAEDGGDEWSNFDDYKIGDGEYDMTGVEDTEQLAKVWKLMTDDDNVVVKQQDGKVELKDNESGAEYLIDLNGGADAQPEVAKTEGDEEPVFEITFNKKPVMKEENLGYTDNYQNKDVVDGKEPYDAPTPNKTNNWDAGAPDSKEKPWAGSLKGKGKPYEGEVNEEEGGDIFEISFDECGGMPVDGPMEEAADSMSTQATAKTTKTQGHHYGGSEPSRDVAKVDSRQGELKMEDVLKKLAVIEEENKVLKSSLVKFRKALNEAVLTNQNIGNVVKLVFENATSKKEKYDILRRFSNEAKTVEQSKALYESIDKQLKSVKKTSVDIDKPMSINESAVKNINESTIYKNDDEAINYALDMIQRMSNL